jgi:hypothetical protein
VRTATTIIITTTTTTTGANPRTVATPGLTDALIPTPDGRNEAEGLSAVSHRLEWLADIDTS